MKKTIKMHTASMKSEKRNIVQVILLVEYLFYGTTKNKAFITTHHSVQYNTAWYQPKRLYRKYSS